METKNVKNPKELKIELKLKIPKNPKESQRIPKNPKKSHKIPKNPMESIRTWPFSTSTSSTSKNPKPKRFNFVSFSFSIFSAELISINTFYYRLFATFCNILTYFVKKKTVEQIQASYFEKFVETLLASADLVEQIGDQRTEIGDAEDGGYSAGATDLAEDVAEIGVETPEATSVLKQSPSIENRFQIEPPDEINRHHLW